MKIGIFRQLCANLQAVEMEVESRKLETIVETIEVSRREELPPLETVMTVELKRAEDEYPKLDRCCFCIDFRIGLNCWLALEVLLWAFLFITALCYEIIYITEVDLFLFMNHTEDWYFYLVFGDRFYLLDQQIRSEYSRVFVNMRLT